MPASSFSFILSVIFIIVLLSVRVAWPWLHAAYTWHESTIQPVDYRSTPSSINPQIPRIIHQTYRDRNSIPHTWQQASTTCRALHADYEYKFWSDEEGRQLLVTEFPSLLPTFDAYPYDIQRADVIRLLVLYVYGGVYLDFDIICLKSLNPLLRYGFILPQTTPAGLSNDVILSAARHPFLLQILQHLPEANRRILTKYPTVMFSTGPMFLTDETSKYADRSALDILSAELYGKYAPNSSHALFRHLKASTWHGNDASVIKWIYRWRRVLLSAMVIPTLCSIYFIQRRNAMNQMRVCQAPIVKI